MPSLPDDLRAIVRDTARPGPVLLAGLLVAEEALDGRLRGRTVLLVAGLVAAGLHPSPVPHHEFVTTTTHKTLRGPRGGMILMKEPVAAAIDKMVFPGIQGGPLMHVIAAKAVAFKEAQEPEFAAYQKQVIVNAQAMAKVVLERGYKVVSGGTDNHLFLWDLTPRSLTGKIEKPKLREKYGGKHA